MSKTVDERVVSMQFDNKHFESNVQTSIGTLDKLKKSLNLDGASKGLENVNHAAQKCDLSPIGKAAESVKVKFSALEVVAVTALANITNSAINAGKRISSALTIEPVITGFSEYETKMNAIQVIKSNTRGKNTMAEITAALDELNLYADKTIYNFTQMTSNVGKFVAQGLDVQTATNAIKGLANLAGASGASAEDMSRATYQMSQALGSSIKLIDWNSLRNANMATTELKNTLIDLAKVHGIAIDDMIEKEGNFEQTLSSGWLTGEIFTEAMNIYSGVYTEAELKAKGFTESQIKNFMDLAAEAESATTDVKTFTQLWDVLKETAQSGWTQSWENIVGDFDTAKERLSTLKDLIEEPISKSAERRNNFLSKVLGGSDTNAWSKIAEQVKQAGIDVDTFQEALIKTGKEHGVVTDKMIKEAGGFEKSLKSGWANAEIFSETFKNMQQTGKATEDMTQKLKEFQKVVDEVWNGDYGNTGDFDQNGEDRVKKLTKAGYDYKTVQDLVNKTVDGHRLTLEDLNEAQMENLGFTEEQIKALKELQKQAKETGTPLNELIEDLTKPTDGGDLLWGTLFNVIKAFQKILETVKGAWREVFQLDASSVYNVIKWLNGFTEKLIISDETAGYLKRTLKGVFAMLNAIVSIAGGAFKIAFQLVSGVLKGFDTNILEVTAKLGDFLTKVAEWIKGHNYLAMGIEKLAEIITVIIKKLHEWITTFLALPEVQEKLTQFKSMMVKVFTTIKDFIVKAADKIKEVIKSLGSGEDINLDWLRDVWVRIKQGFSDAFTGIGSMLNGIKNFFKGFVDVVKSGAKGIGDAFDWIINKAGSFISFLKSRFANIDVGNVIFAGLSLGLIVLLKKISEAFGGYAKILNGIGEILENVGDIANGLGKILKGYSWKLKAEAIRSMVVSILMIVAAIIILTFVDQNKLWSALGVMGALAGGLVGFTLAMSKINTNLDMIKISAFLFGVGSAMMTMAMVVKMLGSMDMGALIQGVAALTIIAGIIVGLLAATRLIAARMEMSAKGDKFAGKGVKGIAAMLLGIAALMLVMSKVVKSLGKMDTGEMAQGLVAITILSGIIVGLMAATRLIMTNKLTGDTISGVASTMLGIAGALLMMSQVVKRLGGMNTGEMIQGLVATTILSALIVALLLAFRLISRRQNGLDTAGVASTMLGIAGALLMLSMVVRMLGGMDTGVLTQGIVATYLLGGLIAALLYVTKYAQSGLKGVASTMIGVGIALLAMTLAVRMLGSMDVGSLVKGTLAVGYLGIIIAGLIKATQFGGNGLKGVAKTLIAVGVAIGIMSLSIGLLSLIEPDRLRNATIAVGMLTTLFGALIVATKFAKKCTSTILTLGITIALLAVAIGALSMIDPTNLAVATGALTSVMYTFAIMTKMTGKAGKAIPTLAALTLVVAALAGIIALLSGLPVESVLGTAIGLSTLMISLAVVAKATQSVNKFNADALGTMAILVAIVAGLAVVIGVLAALDVNPSLETAASLSILMLSLAAVAVIIQCCDPVAAANGVAGFAVVVAGIGALLVALGALAQIPGLKWLIGEGSEVLGMIGFAIGNFIGSIIGGFAAGATSGLPKVAENLSSFMTNLQGFIDGAKKLDSSALSGVKSLVEMILLLSVANLVDTFTSWITGGSSIEKFSRQIKTFGGAIVDFSDIVKGKIDSESVTSAANAGKMLAEMADIIPNSGGLAGFFAGENDIDKFGKKLIPFGEAMVSFSDIVKDKIDSAAVKAAASAGKMMAEMASTIPNSGGLVSFFTGDNTLDTFGAQLRSFGYAMVDFSKAVDGNIDEESVKAAASAGKMMAEMASTIPNSGGLVAFFTGDNRLDDFGVQIACFGEAIVAFSNILSQNGGIDEKAVKAAASAGQMMADMASTIPNSGGLVAFFTGDNRLDAFAVQLPLFGKAMSDFADEVSGSEIEDSTVAAAANAGKALSEMYKTLPKEGGCFDIFTGVRDLTGFGSQLKNFGKAMADFADEVSDSDIDDGCVTAAASAGKALAEMYDAIPNTGGMFEIFTGCKDMGAFGEDLAGFGKAMAEFSDSVDDVDPETIKPAAEAAKTLAEMAKAVPDSGGLWQWFTGAPNLDTFGGQLGNFGSAIKSFSDAISEGDGIDTDRVTAAANAGKIIAEMTQSGKLVEDFFTADNIDTFSESLGLFGEAIVAFSDSISGEDAINVEKVKNAVDAGTAVAELINSEDFKTILSTDLEASGSLEGIEDKVKEIAKILKAFQDELGSDESLDTEKLKSASDACKKLVGLINSDNFKALINYEVKDGEAESLNDVKDKVVAIADILMEFNNSLTGDGKTATTVDTTLITNAVDACTEILKLLTGSKLSDLMDSDVLSSFDEGGSLENLNAVAGYLAGIITSFNAELGSGDTNIDTATITSAVGACTEIIKLLTNDKISELMTNDVLPSFGDGGSLANLKNVASQLGGIIVAFNSELGSGDSQINTTTVSSAITACEDILKLLNSSTITQLIENGTLTSFGEDGSLANIKSVATTLGNIITSFNSALGSGENTIDTEKVINAIDACSEILKMLNSDNFKNLVNLDFKEGGFDGLTTQIEEFGSAMKTMETTLSDINTEVIITASENIKTALDSMNDICTDGIDKIVETLGNSETSVVTAVEDMCSASTDTLTAKGDEFSTAGGELVTKIKEGAEDKESDVKTAFESISKSGASAAKSKTAYDSMYSAGKYLVQGFANGISENSYLAAAKSKAMASAAADAAKTELDERSPSKVFYKIGAFAGMGLVNALDDYGTKAYDAGTTIADYARYGLSNSIAKIASMIDSDMDTQPTIRPVLDLSNISEGAGQINDLFNNPSIVAMSNIGAISSMMSNRQNGANNDNVIAAIKDLGNKLGTPSGDTYNVGDITYDDGSNVSSAVKTLVRAARVERRR